ncbi:MAG: DUF2203 domain-containing protein [Nitrospirae bacterium]|nr:DUF2203 domain-containing protein [Nitrospirota bacterium]
MSQQPEIIVKRTFSFEQARKLLPDIRRITREAATKADLMLADLRTTPKTDPQSPALHQDYENLLNEWADRIVDLGCEVKGVWLVDFDSGHGYYCWKHPEEDLGYFHSYEDGFRGRQRIQ